MFFTLAIFLAQPLAFAQRSFGYAFLGGTFSGHGDMDGAFRYGFGGEGRVAPHLTMGGEIGGVSKNGSGVLGSANASFHFPTSTRAIDPFITGGFSAGHKVETGLWVNLGGGLNYWATPHVGARMEFRGYPGGYHLSSFGEFRLGIIFR